MLRIPFAAATLSSIEALNRFSCADSEKSGTPPPANGPVGVWLDEASCRSLRRRYPKIGEAQVVMLHGGESTKEANYAFKPLFGAETTCKVTGVMSASSEEAVCRSSPTTFFLFICYLFRVLVLLLLAIYTES